MRCSINRFVQELKASREREFPGGETPLPIRVAARLLNPAPVSRYAPEASQNLWNVAVAPQCVCEGERNFAVTFASFTPKG